MLTHHILPDSDLRVSALCYGTIPFGAAVRGEAVDRLYSAFRDAGGNFFDSAHCYCFWLENGDGLSERTLGDLIRCHGDRDHVVVATKGGHPDAGPLYQRPDQYLAPEVIAADIDDSLARLGIDVIDLYYLHRDDPRLPAGEIIETLNVEIKRGRICYLGASNWSTARILEANTYAGKHGLHGFIASQPQWNLAQCNRATEPDPTMRFLSDDDVRWHISHQLPVVAYSSTACGYFATNGRRGAGDFDNPVSRERLQRAQQLAGDLDTTPNQVALAYLMNQEFLAVPIIGTSDPSHLDDAIRATKIRLTPEQVEWLATGKTVATAL